MMHSSVAIPTLGSVVARIRAVLLKLWNLDGAGSIRKYQPERYYMRGPGPAWCQKHGWTGSTRAARKLALQRSNTHGR